MSEEIKDRLGLHIRLQSSVYEWLEKAERLQLPFFQSFLVLQDAGRLITVSWDDVTLFLKARRLYFDMLFCHGSYWINLASLGNNGYPQLRREIILAKRLEFTHFVLHAGSAKGALDKNQGIDALARVLNDLFTRERGISLLLENTCHGNLAVGSDITDFKQLLEKLNMPERIGFCIDTAHAHSFGYDVITQQGQEAFIAFLDATIGIERIKLIHLNDTVEKLGSRIDRHSIVGEGRIGKKALKHFIMHPQLQKIPFLMELPELSLEDEERILNAVRAW